MRVGTDFSGIGSPEQALKNLGVKHTVEFACEIDKYARQSYLANHECKTMYKDITEREFKGLSPLDLYVAGFPCQAFSMAGKRLGFEEARGTLFFNVAEFIKENQPKAFILENVRGLLSHDNGKTFQTIVSILSDNGGTVNGQHSIPYYDDGLGYHINYQVLNTKEHGLPQNRERIFIVGFRDYREYRFPMAEPLKLKLKDMLEDEVADKFYLTEKMINSLFVHTENSKKLGRGFNFEPTFGDGNAKCITSRCSKMGPDDNYIKSFFNKSKDIHNCLTEAVGRAGSSSEYIESVKSVSLNTERIRRLTPLECFRLQGFSDDFKKVCSDTQLYKQSGNTISIPVIQKIIQNLL